MYWPWLEENLYWILGQISTSSFLQFPHNNCLSFWLLHTRVDHFNTPNTPIPPVNEVDGDILVSPWLSVCLSVCPSESLTVEEWFLHNNFISFWPKMMILHTSWHVLPMTGGRPLWFWDEKVKSQGQICTLKLHQFRIIIPLLFDILWWYFTHY